MIQSLFPSLCLGWLIEHRRKEHIGGVGMLEKKTVLLFLYNYCIYVVTLFSGNTKGPSASAKQHWLNPWDPQRPLSQIPFGRAGSSWWHCHFVNKEVRSCESALFQNTGQDARVLGKTFPLWVFRLVNMSEPLAHSHESFWSLPEFPVMSLAITTLFLYEASQKVLLPNGHWITAMKQSILHKQNSSLTM